MLNVTFDVGGTGTKCIFFDNEKEIKYLYLPYEEYQKREEIIQIPLQYVLNKIKTVLDDINEEFNLAIAFPGVVDAKNKKILTVSAICDVEIDIPNYFSQFKNIKKFIIQNDAKAATWGEFTYRTNNNSDIENMMHLTIGTSLGTGLIINKKIYNGRNLLAGEVGKMYSCISGYNPSTVGFDTGMGTTLIKYLLKTGKKITGEEFFDLYNQKDELATKMMNDFTSQIAKVIINLDLFLDLDLITLGGGVSDNEQFNEMIKNKIYKHKDFYWGDKLIYSDDLIESKFSISQLRNKATCYGLMYLLQEGEK